MASGSSGNQSPSTSNCSADEDMKSILHSVSLSHLAENFAKEKVTPDIVPLLSDNSLNCLGVGTIGARAMLKSKCQTYLRDKKVESETNSIFGRSQTNPPTSYSQGGSKSRTESLFAEADRLINSLRSGNVGAIGRRSKHPKRKNEAFSVVSKRKCPTEQQRRVVVINYPGKKVEDTTPLHDDDIVVDGFVRFLSSADEKEIRIQISDVIRNKKSPKMDFSDISPDDFEYVIVSNKKVRVPDGNVPFDAVSLNKAYRGIVYARLTKDFKKKIRVNRCPKCALCVPVADLSSHERRCTGVDFDSEPEDHIDLTRNTESNESDSEPLQTPLSSPTAPPYSPITPVTNKLGENIQESDLAAIEDDMVKTAIQSSLSDRERPPEDQKQVISLLQRKCGFRMPVCASDYYDLPCTEIDVRREMVVNDGLRAAKKKRFDPAKLLKVCFIGEPAIDTGGLTREFWRLLNNGFQEKYCMGVEGKKVFSHNVPALENHDFKYMGLLIAMSVVQGGPGFPVLAPHIYDYITSGDYLRACIPIEDVPDSQVRHLLSQLEEATSDDAVKGLFMNDDSANVLMDTGFSKPLTCLTG